MDLKNKQEIARENGKKSRGPVTPEGKQRSSLNGITHGLASKCVVLANESEQAYTDLLTGYQNQWQPANITEQHLVIQIANSYWRLRRIWSMETALLESEMFAQKVDFEAAWSHHHPAMRAVDALTAIQVANPGTLTTLHRYENRYQRIHKSSIDQLRKLRRDRRAPEISFSVPAKPVNISGIPDPADEQPHSEIQAAPDPPSTPLKPAWQTHLLGLLLSILSALRSLPGVGKHQGSAKNARSRPSEPTTLSESLVSNFHLPEFFDWLSEFTSTPARPKADFSRPEPEKPNAV